MNDPLERRLRDLPLRNPSPALDRRVRRVVDGDAKTGLEERLAALPLRPPSPKLDRRVAAIRPRPLRLRVVTAAAALMLVAVGLAWIAQDRLTRAPTDLGTGPLADRQGVVPARETPTPIWIGYPERTEVIHDLGYQAEGDAVLHRLHGLKVESYHLIDAVSGERIRVDIPLCREYRRRLEIY